MYSALTLPLRALSLGPQQILVEFTQAKISLLDRISVGDEVQIQIDIRGREWSSPRGDVKYFVSIQGWQIPCCRRLIVLAFQAAALAQKMYAVATYLYLYLYLARVRSESDSESRHGIIRQDEPGLLRLCGPSARSRPGRSALCLI